MAQKNDELDQYKELLKNIKLAPNESLQQLLDRCHKKATDSSISSIDEEKMHQHGYSSNQPKHVKVPKHNIQKTTRSETAGSNSIICGSVDVACQAEDDVWNVIFIGEDGAGKSSTINTLINKNYFDVKQGFMTVTNDLQTVTNNFDAMGDCQTKLQTGSFVDSIEKIKKERENATFNKSDKKSEQAITQIKNHCKEHKTDQHMDNKRKQTFRNDSPSKSSNMSSITDLEHTKMNDRSDKNFVNTKLFSDSKFTHFKQNDPSDQHRNENSSRCLRKIHFIDTPPFNILKRSDEFKQLFIQGFHAVVLVFPAQRLSVERLQFLQDVEDYFGQRIFDYIIVAFTFTDTLDDEFDTSFKDTGEKFQAFMSKVKQSFVQIQNPTGSGRELFYHKLREVTERMRGKTLQRRPSTVKIFEPLSHFLNSSILTASYWMSSQK